APTPRSRPQPAGGSARSAPAKAPTGNGRSRACSARAPWQRRLPGEAADARGRAPRGAERASRDRAVWCDLDASKPTAAESCSLYRRDGAEVEAGPAYGGGYG